MSQVFPPLRIALASASPRRIELMRDVYPDFEVEPADVDETLPEHGNPWTIAVDLALLKAETVFQRSGRALVIGGDTVVALPPSRRPPATSPLAGINHPESGEGEYEILGKPTSPEDAKAMLRRLSGKTHLVITGIALVYPGSHVTDTDTTDVTFRELTDEEIDAYVATGEPMDKAGAYAIQGGAAGFVTHIVGSYSNVVGLPVEVLRLALEAVWERAT